MSPFNTLANVTPEMINRFPFPHIVIRNALPDNVYQALDKAYPLQSIVADGETQFQTRRVSNNAWKDVHDIWHQFHAYHSSAEWSRTVLEFFRDFLDQDIFDRYYTAPEEIKTWTVFSVNGLSEIRVQTPHLDHACNLYVGLFYMRDKDDTGSGGDLEIYRTLVEDVEFGEYRKPRADQIEIESVVPYSANTMVWMLTGPRSIHGASSRTNASNFRKYININTRVPTLAHPYP